VLLFILIVLALLTISRNPIWDTDITLWQNVVARSASKGRPQNDLAMAEFRVGHIRRAISGYKKALTLGEGIPMVRSNLGVAFVAMGRFEDAEAEQSRAIVLMPTYAPAHTNLAIALHALGKTEDSLAAFRRAASLTELPRERRNLANAYRRAGHLDEAIEGFRALLRAYKTPAIHNDLGLVLTSKGDVTAAMAEYKKALAMDNKYVNSLINVAALYMRSGDSVAALENYNAALLIDPDNSILHYHLGLFYETADKTNKARSHYDRFIALAGAEDRALVRGLQERLPLKSDGKEVLDKK
jgi:tetratricopeptide (TPR) repeat protein